MFPSAGHRLARRERTRFVTKFQAGVPGWHGAPRRLSSVRGVAAGAKLADARRMSAIQSLLRVMTLRDAEAIILEAGKVPSLRRRGQIEQLMMPPIEARLIEDFIAPLVNNAPISDWPASVPFHDDDGTAYHVAIEKVASGTRLNVRKAKPAAAAAASPAPVPSAPAPKAWWAKADKPAAAAVAVSVPVAVAVSSSVSDDSRADALARVSHLLAPLVSQARDHGAADLIVSTRQPPRMRVDGRLEPLDL